MDTIKAANKIIKDGIALLPDDAKGDFKAQAGDIFINEAIANALGVCATAEEEAKNKDDSDSYRLRKEKQALLRAYAVQEANRVVTTLWRLELLPEDMEKAYRELPAMVEMASAYNEFTDARKAEMDAIMANHKVIADEEKELDIFKGIINGISAKEAERKYEDFKKSQQQAMGAR